MTYVNITGKDIGDCLTGFAINYPIKITNSGNSDVLYKFSITNDSDEVFSSSISSVIINNGDTETLDILYCPLITTPASDNICNFIIESESVEDGSVDPSGNITIEVTGSRIINNTGGHVRNLVALKNYDIKNGINYDFIWSPPTGTGNLKNYFFTGYQLDIATNTNFSTIVFSTGFNIAQNTTDKPRYSNFYGYSEDEKIIKKIGKKDFTSLNFDISYYARLYTYSCGNTGINIFATGVESLNDQLSNEVIIGNSGVTRPDLKFSKKMLNVQIAKQNSKDFDLFNEIFKANAESYDLTFYSGINIYFAEGSSFYSSDENNYAINLKGSFQNFSGNGTDGTPINLYIPQKVFIYGNEGKGGDIKNLLPKVITQGGAITNYDYSNIFEQSNYSITNGLSDSRSGGNVFNFNLDTQIYNETVKRKDLVYNIFIQKTTNLAAGGGGNKAGFAIVGGYANNIATGSDGIPRSIVLPIRGSKNYENTYFFIKNKNSTSLDNLGKLYSPDPQLGEDAIDNIVFYDYNKRQYITNAKITNYASNSATVTIGNNGLQNLETQFVKINNNSAASSGYLINKFAGSKVKLNFYNNNISSDYVFRFDNSYLTSTPTWLGKDINNNTIITLSGTGSRIDFRSLGLNALKLTNTQSLKGVFSSSVDVTNFDLFIVGCVEGVTANTFPKSIFKFFNWYSNSSYSQVTNLQLENFPTSNFKAFPKEENVFSLFFPLLYNQNIEGSFTTTFYESLNISRLGNLQISKQFNSSIDGYYPFIINIQRTNKVYIIYINGVAVCNYTLPNNNFLLNNLNATTFDLLNGVASGASVTNNLYFDMVFYNRNLFDGERLQLYNYYVNTYLKLFTGYTDSFLKLDQTLSDQRVRLPNVFNIAGKIKTQS